MAVVEREPPRVLCGRTQRLEADVEMALKHLEKDNIVVLDDERKAQMVSNLLVVLCSEQAAQPVVNAGTLYG